MKVPKCWSSVCPIGLCPPTPPEARSLWTPLNKPHLLLSPSEKILGWFLVAWHSLAFKRVLGQLFLPEPQVGGFRLNKDPLVLPSRSPPHSSTLGHPNKEPPTTSPGAWLLRRRVREQEATGSQHSLLGQEVRNQPAVVSQKT